MPRPTDWFHTYFSEPYGEIYADYLLAPAVSAREAAFVRRVLGLRARDRVLDCPCGYGRHLERLAQGGRRGSRPTTAEPDATARGESHASGTLALRRPRTASAGGRCVVGLDLNADCLRRAAEAVLPPGASLVRGDMRHLPFPAASFDAVVNLFNSFGYFGPEENRRVLREFARVLAPGGRVLLDLANPAPLIDLIREMKRTEIQRGDLTQVEHWRYDGRTRRLHNRTELTLGGRRLERSYDFRLYTFEEVAALLEHAGLEPTALYGNFDREIYDPNGSDRLIIVAERESEGTTSPARTKGTKRT
jgi:SAM-dependent methyltransferase